MPSPITRYRPDHILLHQGIAPPAAYLPPRIIQDIMATNPLLFRSSQASGLFSLHIDPSMKYGNTHLPNVLLGKQMSGDRFIWLAVADRVNTRNSGSVSGCAPKIKQVRKNFGADPSRRPFVETGGLCLPKPNDPLRGFKKSPYFLCEAGAIIEGQQYFPATDFTPFTGSQASHFAEIPVREFLMKATLADAGLDFYIYRSPSMHPGHYLTISLVVYNHHTRQVVYVNPDLHHTRSHSLGAYVTYNDPEIGEFVTGYYLTPDRQTCLPQIQFTSGRFYGQTATSSKTDQSHQDGVNAIRLTFSGNAQQTGRSLPPPASQKTAAAPMPQFDLRTPVVRPQQRNQTVPEWMIRLRQCETTSTGKTAIELHGCTIIVELVRRAKQGAPAQYRIYPLFHTHTITIADRSGKKTVLNTGRNPGSQTYTLNNACTIEIKNNKTGQTQNFEYDPNLTLGNLEDLLPGAAETAEQLFGDDDPLMTSFWLNQIFSNLADLNAGYFGKPEPGEPEAEFHSEPNSTSSSAPQQPELLDKFNKLCDLLDIPTADRSHPTKKTIIKAFKKKLILVHTDRNGESSENKRKTIEIIAARDQLLLLLKLADTFVSEE